MLNKRTRLIPSLMLITSLLLFTACTPKGEKLQEQLNTAWHKQQDVVTHQMEGSAQLQLDLPLPALSDDSNPLTSVILQSLLHSSYDWQGLSDAKSIHYEMDMALQPSTSDLQFDLPVLIEDGHLYFHLPMINQDEEYMDIPLGDSFNEANNQTTGAMSRWLEGMAAALDPDWLEEADTDNENSRSIHVAVTKERLKPVMEAAASQWEKLLQAWQKAGLDTSALEAASIPDYLRSAVYRADGELSYTLDNASGFIQDTTIRLPFAVEGKDQIISFHYTWNQINQELTFTKAKPQQTKTLEEIYPLLKK